ncbi:MAG: tRNA (adenosine(37)-N6)-threonylcarbamoyltransferase complex ATPase subunit type 1 TsaE, partial [Candidatus Omnitrophica bacterium]|nr:tRNA (adenosine(37)-N6)-threonylcarbamoyltransferase complex ATPase subunit type 1 TsaE [Candidatus Omnitrophota bacterium]
YVNSPTFVIIKQYKGRLPLYHFDIYRLDSSSALDTTGYEEYFYGKGVTVVEWADKIQDILPKRRIHVELFHNGENKRKIKIKDIE